MPQTVRATRYYIDDEHFCTTRDDDVRWPAMHELVAAEDVEVADTDPIIDGMHAACEALFAKYNRDDRPDGRTRRCTSSPSEDTSCRLRRGPPNCPPPRM